MRGLTIRSCLLAGTVALVVAVPAAATPPRPQAFKTIGHLTGPDSAAGTWTATGLVQAHGTYTETFRLTNDNKTIHGQKVLVSPTGTIVLEIRNIVVLGSDGCTAGFKAGSWQIAEATGAYAHLKGGGEPGTLGSANVCTGDVDVVHAGSAHFETPRRDL
jgi:hypothetical protein